MLQLIYWTMCLYIIMRCAQVWDRTGDRKESRGARGMAVVTLLGTVIMMASSCVVGGSVPR